MQKNDKMNKELLIRSSSNNVDFALLKDGKLIEFHKDNDNTKFLVGDIYLAKIRKTMPALNAAFVNVGYKKDAFLLSFPPAVLGEGGGIFLPPPPRDIPGPRVERG